MSTHTATSRVCLTADGKLCAESDPKAAFLFCPEGAAKKAEELKGHENAGEFFTGFGKVVKKDDARVDAPVEKEEVTPKHGKPAKVQKHRE